MAKKLKTTKNDLFKVDIPELKKEPDYYNPENNVVSQEVTPSRLGTDCNECIFHQVEGKNCLLGKIDKFVERGALIEKRDDKFLLDRVCSFRRTEGWKKQNRSRRNIDQCALEANKEVNITGTIVVYADSLEDLDKCFQQLSETNYVENFKIVVAHFDDLKITEVYDYFHSQNYIASPIAVGIKTDEGINFLDEAFKRAVNGLLITVDSKQDVNKNMLHSLQKYMYEEMHRLIYVKPSSGIHELVSLALLYKYLRGNKIETFEEKIQQIAKEQNIESQITTWEDINESIG